MILWKGEGLLFRYAPEDKDGGEQSHYSSLGVSGLLGGQSGALIPVGTRRMARREQHEHEHEAEPNGNGNGNARSTGNGKSHAKNGHTKVNGNGHANGNRNSLSLRERAGVGADSNDGPFELPIIDRLS